MSIDRTRPPGGARGPTAHSARSGHVLLALDFEFGDLGRIRSCCREVLRRAGLGADRVLMFVFAINEGLINAVEHGGGGGRLVVLDDGVSLIAQISDQGAGTTRRLPAVEAVGGRGLWLAQRMVDQVTLESGPDGTTLRLEVTHNGPHPYPWVNSRHDITLARQIEATLFPS